MASFTPSGVEFVAKGLSGYLGDLHKADQAQQSLGKSASNIGGHFASAQSGVSSFASTVGGSSGILSSFVSSLGQMAVVAGGNLLASGFQALAGGVRDFASAGLEAVSHAQTLEASLGALLTQNNLYQQTTETMTVAVGNLVEIQADAAKKSDDLAFKQRELTAEINTQNASIQEQRQRIMQMADGLDKNQQVARLQEMEVALEGMNRELAEAGTEQGKLNNITQEYETVSKTAWQQVMNMGDAQALAKDQTKDLLGFIEKLAIVSPFEQEDVEKVTQYAIGAGLGVDATKDFTAGFLDLAAAVGITSPNLDEAAYQLLQVKKAGILTAVDLRQLSTRGIDLAKIIGVQMGMSVDEFNAKAKTTPAIFDQLIQAVTDYSQNTFAGTSQAMSQSIEGFRSTVSDLFTQSAKKVLRPLVDAVTPTVAEMISRAAEFISGGQAEAIGQALADSVMGGFAVVSESISKVMGAFDKFGLRGASVSILGQLGLDQSQISETMAIFDQITEAIDKVSGAFDRFGLKGATVSIIGQLGIDPETIGTIFITIDTIIEKITTLQTIYAQFGAMGAGVSLLSMLGFSSETIGTITTTLQAITDGFVAFGNWWVTNWPVMQAVALTAWEVIKGIFDGLVTALGPTFTQLQTTFGKLSETIGSLGISWTDVFNALLTATGIVAAGIGAALLGIIGVLAGVVTGVASGVDAMIQTFMALWTQVGVVFDGIGLLAKGWVDMITALINGEWAAAWEGFKTIVEGAFTIWKGLISSLLVIATGAFNTVLGVVSGFAEGIIGFFQGMYDSLIGHSIIPDLINGIVKWFKDLPQKIFNALGDLKSKVTAPFSDLGRIISQEVMPVVRDFTDDLLPALGKGIDFVIEGIKNFISSIKEAASALADMVVPDWLEMHSPPPLATAFNMIGAGAGNATQAIAGMQQTMLSSTASTDRFIDSLNMGGFAANSMLSNWNDVRDILHLNIGANMGRLATGELSGADIPRILGEQAGVWNVPPGMLQDIAEAQGLVDHFSETFLAFQKQIRIENLTNMTQMAGSFSSLGSSFADMLQTQMGDSKAAKSEVDKLIQSNTKLDKSNLDITDSISDQQQKMAILQAELADLTTQEELDILAIDKKKLAIDELTEAMEKNRLKLLDNQRALKANSLELATLATSSDAGMIEALRAFLADDSQDMFHMHKELADGTISDFFIDRNAAQIRYNELLEEQRRQEELITRQKEAQQKLDFLKSQLDLIKLGQELGGNIFQGITFGLNASVEDLLAATNAIVEAMVTQIDQDLQLGSPSRLMIGMFQNVMEGAAIGVQKGAGALEYAFNSSLSPFLNAGQRMLAPTGTSYNSTNNNYFNMNVNTGASASSVIRQYEVARSMI